jgi:hypothetical protein
MLPEDVEKRLSKLRKKIKLIRRDKGQKNRSSFGSLLIVRIFFVARRRFIPPHGTDYHREGL